MRCQQVMAQGEVENHYGRKLDRYFCATLGFGHERYRLGRAIERGVTIHFLASPERLLVFPCRTEQEWGINKVYALSLVGHGARRNTT